MYEKVLNGVVDTFPYYINTLKEENPNTSFPSTMTNEMLVDWNVYPVAVEDLPTTAHNETVSLDTTPTENNGVWTVGWTVRVWTSEELTELEDQVRNQRDKKLNASDWTQMPDSPLSDADKTLWQTYRQALRDIPAQTNFPTDITWPTEP